MFNSFSADPFISVLEDVLREVRTILDLRGLAFANLITAAFRDEASWGEDIVSGLTEILKAFLPYIDRDEKTRTTIGRVFTLVVSSELSRLEKGNDAVSWCLSATALASEKLMGFNLKEMGTKIASGAPGFPSFLGGICTHKMKLDSSEMDVDESGEDDTGDEPGKEAKERLSPAHLLEIVSLLLVVSL